MSSPISYTTYDPGKRLSEQLETLSKPPSAIIPSLIRETIAFKPLKVNGMFLDLSLIAESAFGSSKEGPFIYDKYSFTIKSKDNNKLNLKGVPVKEIDGIIAEIFRSSAAKL